MWHFRDSKIGKGTKSPEWISLKARLGNETSTNASAFVPLTVPRGLCLNGIHEPMTGFYIPSRKNSSKIRKLFEENTEQEFEDAKLQTKRFAMTLEALGSVNSSTTRLEKYNLSAQAGKLAGIPTPRGTFNPTPHLCSYNNQLFTRK